MISIVSLVVLLVFLLGVTIRKLDRAEADRDQVKTQLDLSQQQVVDKLVQYLQPVIQREVESLRLGQTPQVSLESVLEKLKGLDPSVIQQAVEKAMKAVGGTTVTTRASAVTSTTQSRPSSSSTTSTMNTTTTTKPKPQTTTTTKPSQTTTTTMPKKCTVKLELLGLCV